MNLAATTSPTDFSYHRGDPLEIPLIDDHLLTHFLMPRITSSIKLAFPQVYLDWTTGLATQTTISTTAANGNDDIGRSTIFDGGIGNEGHHSSSGAANNTLFWKRIVEGILRACLFLGSFHHIAKKISVTTPAMQSLGICLQPKTRNNATVKKIAVSSCIQKYFKVVALVVAMVIPSLYEQLKEHRERQLEERERRLQLEEIHCGFRSSHVSTGERIQLQPSQQRPQTLREIVQQRANERRSLFRSVLTDAILGVTEVFLAPLKLINHVSYLWGFSTTPSVAMMLAGWEYVSVTRLIDSSDMGDSGMFDVSPSGRSGMGDGKMRHQRHANFQYANRRLLVEEALRTMSMVLPPRNGVRDGVDNGHGVQDAAVDAHPNDGIDEGSNSFDLRGGRSVGSRLTPGGNSTESWSERWHRSHQGWMLSRTLGNKLSWVRKYILSLMGVAVEDENDRAALRGNERKYSLICTICRAENPTIPYIASCGHCYCYLCLRMAVMDNLSFCCVACGKQIVSSGRPNHCERVDQRENKQSPSNKR